VTTSPFEVGAAAFEDEGGAVRAFICNPNDQAREISLEFRGRTIRRAAAPGELLEVALSGRSVDREAFPTPTDLRTPAEVRA
jgi:hypothetical protein